MGGGGKTRFPPPPSCATDPKNKMCASELQKCSFEEQNVCIRTSKVFIRRTKCVHLNYKSVHPKNKMCGSDLNKFCILPLNKCASKLQKVCIRQTNMHLTNKCAFDLYRICASDLYKLCASNLQEVFILNKKMGESDFYTSVHRTFKMCASDLLIFESHLQMCTWKLRIRPKSDTHFSLNKCFSDLELIGPAVQQCRTMCE